MNRTSRLVRWWTVAACVLMMAAGCSQDPDSGGSDEPTSQSPSPSPSESASDEPTEPPVPEAMANEDKAGAKAFVQYYWDVVAYAQVTGDVSTLRELAFPTCGACVAGLKSIRETVPKATKIAGGEVTVSNVKVTALQSGSKHHFQVDYAADNSRQVVIHKDGTKDVYDAGRSRYRNIVSLDDDGEWRVGLVEV
ncbi:MAG: DUF6318 family protein, partial [Nocardioides sp.]|nr:DUF6318 family protein [Nocardioides sp.]